MITAMGLNMTATAQKAINSVHFYDVKNAAMEKTYIASLKKSMPLWLKLDFRIIIIVI